ncbi:MAG: O-antigen ligase family protein, partial [Rhodanobacter sp.]
YNQSQLSLVTKANGALLLVGTTLLATSRPIVAVYAPLVVGCVTYQTSVSGINVDVLTALLLALAIPLWRNWSRDDIPVWLFRGALLVVAGGAFSLFGAVNTSLALWGTLRWILVLNWAFALFALVNSHRRAEVLRLATTISAISGAVAAIGFLQSRGVYLPLVGSAYSAGRPDSTFGYYSNYANFLALSSVIAIGCTAAWVGKRRLFMASLVAAAVAISSYEVVGAASRGAVLLGIIGLTGWVLLACFRPGRFITRIIALSAAGIVFDALVPNEQKHFLMRRFEATQDGDARRYALSQAGQHLLMDNALGIGFGNFKILTRQGPHAHNMYVQIGLDVGWVGLAGFLVMMAFAVWRGVVSGITSRGTALQGAFAAALVGYAAQGTFDYFFFETGSLLYFVALIVGAAAKTEPARDGLCAESGLSDGNGEISRERLPAVT